MAFTAQDLADFNRFAEEKLSICGVDNIDQLTREWREARNLKQLVDDIAESEADVEAGRVRPLDEAFSDMRQKLGFTE